MFSGDMIIGIEKSKEYSQTHTHLEIMNKVSKFVGHKISI